MRKFEHTKGGSCYTEAVNQRTDNMIAKGKSIVHYTIHGKARITQC